MKESPLQSQLRLAASKAGWHLWRNNVGAIYTPQGSFLRYGLCNDSKALNEKIKSADLIGIKPVWITPEMVGTLIGQFVSREVKRSDWVYSGTPKEKAQLAWRDLILALGGDASFTTGEL